ncbi:MAG TPA: cupin domain-containing protein [Rectinemataceae bacterium]
MIVRPGQRETECRPNMRGGKGQVYVSPLAGAPSQAHLRLASEILVPPGSSIGKHEHTAETEYYYVLEGRGLVDDDGVVAEVGPGDAILTAGGASHSVEAFADAPLRMLAFIVTDA